MMTSGSKNKWILLLLLGLGSFSACTALTPGTSATNTTGPILTTTAIATTTPTTTVSATTTGDRIVEYKLLNSGPVQIQTALETFKKDRGYLYFPKDKILVIFMGQRTTGGYSMQLNSISKVADTLVIKTLEKSPKPGDIVTQAFTYPKLIIQLIDDYTTFKIQDSSGSPYENLEGVQY